MATILIVDDEAPNRELVATLVRYAGHQALEAADGSLALELVRQAQPDLVVCDLLMPVMDGYEFVRQLRAQVDTAGTRVIFYTATYLEGEARALAAACGVQHLLFKPCEPEQILQTIALALQQPVPQAALPDADGFDREHLRLLTDKLALKADELETSNQRLRRANRVYGMLSSINSLIVRAGSREQLLRESCQVAVERGQYQLAWIGGLEDGASEGTVQAWFGDDGSYVRLIHLTTALDGPFSKRPASQALQSLKPFVSNDVRAEPALADLLDVMLALVLLDVERFKAVNQAYGRQGGDALLKQLADRLRASPDARLQAARISADRYALILQNFGDAAEAARVMAAHYRQWFDAPFVIQGQASHVSAKIGIAVFPTDGLDAETLYRNTESALKKAKSSTERVLFYDQRMAEAVGERLALEGKLRLALEREEFVLHYQAKVDVDTRRLEGVEALIRWNSPELGLVPPVRFIPLLEESGLIVEVGLWALRRAALDHARWRAQGLAAPRIAVNVSAVQLREPDFVSRVAALLAEQAAPQGIDIELTESLLMEDVESNIGKLNALRDCGVRLSIDDFGTGYSSLAYLAKLPAEILKIDRAFILTMLDDPNTMTLVSTMISMAHSLRMKVVAEGVETEEQAKILRLLRCDQMQGYLIARPLPFEDLRLDAS